MVRAKATTRPKEFVFRLEMGPFKLAVEEDELLGKQRIFGNMFFLRSRKIINNADR